MNRESCLRIAHEAVCVGREVAHGSPEDTFGRIARLWEAYLLNRADLEGRVVDAEPLTGADVAAMLALVKIARVQGNPMHADSWVDIAGYAACGCEIGTRGTGRSGGDG